MRFLVVRKKWITCWHLQNREVYTPTDSETPFLSEFNLFALYTPKLECALVTKPDIY